MQNQPRARSLADRLALLDEADTARSPSYFEWREQTVRMEAFRPVPKSQPKANPIVRMFRRFA